MVGLLDVNVLVALLVPAHEHHALARRWVARWRIAALSDQCGYLPIHAITAEANA